MKSVLVFITVTLLLLEISYCENMDKMEKENNMLKTKMDNWKFDPENGNVVIYRRQAVKQMDTNNYHVVETEMKKNGGYRIRTFYADEENGKKLESPKMQEFLKMRGRDLKDPEAKVMPMKKMTNDFPKKMKKGKNLKDSGIVQIQTDLNKITQKPVTTETTTPMVSTEKVKVTTKTTTPIATTSEKVTTEKTIPTTTKIVETTKVPEKSTTEKLEIKTTEKIEVPSTTIKTTEATTVGTTKIVQPNTTVKAAISTTETTTSEKPKPEPVTEKSTTTPKIVEETKEKPKPEPVTEKSTTTTKVPVEVKSSTALPTTVKISEEKEEKYFPEMPGDLKIPVSVQYTEIKRTTSAVPAASTSEETSSSSVDVTKVAPSSPRGSQKFENTV